MSTASTLIKNVHVLMQESENGGIIQNEHGHWLIMDLRSETMFYLEPTEDILSFFDIKVQETISETRTSNKENKQQEEEGRCTWNRGDILRLIDLYKKYEPSFKSSTIKNDKVWQKIASELGSHTMEQCRKKFKYLKAKYVEKKDNMSSRATGSKSVKFEYFEQFNEIFAEDPNIEPIAVACSSRGKDNIPIINLITSSSTRCATPPETCENAKTNQDGASAKKRKRSLLEKQLNDYGEKLEQREVNKERRHQECLQKQEEALAVFRKIASSFEKYVNKNDSI